MVVRSLSARKAAFNGVLVSTRSGTKVWHGEVPSVLNRPALQLDPICRALAVAADMSNNKTSRVKGFLLLQQQRCSLAYVFEQDVIVAVICDADVDRTSAHAKAHELYYVINLLFGMQISHMDKSLRPRPSQQQLDLHQLLLGPGAEGSVHGGAALHLSHELLAGYLTARLQHRLPVHEAFSHLSGLPARISSHHVELDEVSPVSTECQHPGQQAGWRVYSLTA